MRKGIKVTVSIYTMLALLTSCAVNVPNNSNLKNESKINSGVFNKYAISGKTQFPAGKNSLFSNNTQRIVNTPNILFKSGIRNQENNHRQQFKTKATFEQVGASATVSLMYLPDDPVNPNVTIATGVTDASGNFYVIPYDYIPVHDKIYVLEASKRIGGAGNAVISMRTYIQWDATNFVWKSMTYPDLYINSKTTALGIIDSYESDLSPEQTIHSIDVSGPGSVPDNLIGSTCTTGCTVSTITSAKVLSVAALVDNLLTQDVDPLRNISMTKTSKTLVGSVTNTATISPNTTTITAAPSIGTNFLSDLQIGDEIKISQTVASVYHEDIVRVVSIASHTSMITTTVINANNLQGAGGASLKTGASYFLLEKKYYINTEINHGLSALNSGLNCPSCDLSNENLISKDYSGKNLSYANFSNSNLSNANLNGADLTGANFTGANLSGTTWSDGVVCQNGSVGVCLPSIIGEFHVNTYITHNQKESSIAMDNNGNFVIIWESYAQDSPGINDYGIYAQRYNSIGIPQGSEFKVNTYTRNYQSHPAVAMDNTGNFVVTWESYTQDGHGFGIYAQRYKSNGATNGAEFLVNTEVLDYQSHPAVAMDNTGNFIIVWQSYAQDGAAYGIYGKKYNSSGTAVTPTGCGTTIPGCNTDPTEGTFAEFLVNTYTTDFQVNPAVSMDGSGNFIVTWESYSQDGDGYGIYAQKYNTNGSPSGSEFLVNTYTTNFQASPTVDMNVNGDFVISWQSKDQDGSDYEVYAQRYNSNGVGQIPSWCSGAPTCNATTGEFPVNTFTGLAQKNPSVSMDNTGNFIIAWQSYQESAYTIFAQRYNSSGDLIIPSPCAFPTCDPLTGEFIVNTTTTDSQASPSIIMDSTGNFIVTWQSYDQYYEDRYGVYGKRYNSLGEEL